MYYKTCAICGLKAGRTNNKKRMFMANFPLDEERCKQWVKVVGKKYLAYVPIEKLHSLKNICGKHFKPQDFKRKKTQLKKTAIPSLEITGPPLKDEILIGFPLHVNVPDHIPDDNTHLAERDHTYCTKNFTYEPDPKPVAEGSSETDLPPETGDDAAAADNIEIRLEDDPVSDSGECQEAEEVPVDASPFSWQQLTEDVDTIEDKQSALDDDDVTFYGETQLVPDVSSPLSRTEEEYSCNVCHERVAGFRYACVQCRDWDLCGACEARGEHATHYVLRVPPHKTHRETRSVLAALRHVLTDIAPREPDVALVKKEVKTEDPLAEAEVPLEPSLEALAQTDVEDAHQVQEEDLNTSRTEEKHIYSTYRVPPAPHKRKMPPHTDIQTSSPNKQKRIIRMAECPKSQCLDSAQKSYVLTSGVPKKNSYILTETPIEKYGSQTETGEVMFLDDIDTTSKIVVESSGELGRNVHMLELPSSSTSDDHYMVLEVVGSRQLRVNMTQLNDEEIMSATKPRQTRSKR